MISKASHPDAVARGQFPRPRLRRMVQLITMGASLPLLIAAWAGPHWFGTWGAFLWVVAVVLGLEWRMRLVMNEGRRPSWVGGLALPLFDGLWVSLLLSAVAVVLSLAVSTLIWTWSRGSFGSSWFSAVRAGVAVAGAVGLYGALVRVRMVRVRRVYVGVPGWPQGRPRYRIAHLSDLHVGTTAPSRYARRWARITTELAPDLVAVTGDLVVAGSAYAADVAEVLGSIRAPDGVAVVFGNHDYDRPDAFEAALSAAGCRVLRNAGLVRSGLWVCGIEDRWRGRPDLGRALAGCPPEMPKVLLSHHPNVWSQARDAGVEVVLAGHVHGGQLAVPGLADRFNLGQMSTPLALGVFRDRGSTLVVSAGLGTTGPVFRLGAAPEIVLIELGPDSLAKD